MAGLTGFESGLEQKVGPLPAYAWGGIAASGVYLFVRHRNAKNAAAAVDAAATPQDGSGLAADAVDPTATDTSSAGLGSNPLDQYLNGDPTNSAYPVGSIAQGAPAPITNAQWARLAGDYLMSKGDDPSLVQTALAKYLAGTALASAEQSVVNEALTAFGSPPEGVKAVTTVPPPTAGTPAGTAVKFPNQTHKVGSATTVNSLVRRFYPNATAHEQAEIVYTTVLGQPQYGNGVPANHQVTLISQFVKD